MSDGCKENVCSFISDSETASPEMYNRLGRIANKLQKDLALAKEGLEFYGEGNSHYDSKYEWGEGHDPERGQETCPSGYRSREILAQLDKKDGE